MTEKDIIRMAREAGFTDSYELGYCYERLMVFAALVAAAEREARIEAQKLIEALQAENISNEANRLAAVLNEREACAKVCDDINTEYEGGDVLATWCAAAIRARGETK